MSSFLAVKNFARFQHYKDRAPPWIKLYNELLDDYEFGELPDASKAHLLAIWLLASRTDNRIPNDPKWIARKINATERVDIALLVRTGFLLLHDASSSLAERTQDACLETETETETEAEGETEPREARGDVPSTSEFAEFWAIYPNHVAKRAALKAFTKARQRAEHSEIIAGAARYAHDPTRKPEFTAHPATWLNADRWLDEPVKSGVEAIIERMNGENHDEYR